jgi:dimethylargininase
VARGQHAEYERCLVGLGCAVRQLPADDEMADSVFIEDTAIVFDEVAIITRPGAVSRRRETDAVAGVLGRYRAVRSISEPATMDGGDVVVARRRVFVGVSSRTNAAAVAQMRELAEPFGYRVDAVRVGGCLHLKSAVTTLDLDTLLINRRQVDASCFDGFRLIDVDDAEPSAANALPVNGAIVFPREFPRTRDRLAAAGFDVRTVPAGELAKAEGAVTCCSLIFAVGDR